MTGEAWYDAQDNQKSQTFSFFVLYDLSLSTTRSLSKACNYSLPWRINSSRGPLHLTRQHMQHTPDHTCNHVVEADGRKCNYKGGGQVGRIRAATRLFARESRNDYLNLFLTTAVYSGRKKNKAKKWPHFGSINPSSLSVSLSVPVPWWRIHSASFLVNDGCD